MPKPLKKATPKKPAAKKRPSSDPNLRARQMVAEHMAKVASAQPPWAKDFAPAGIEVTYGQEIEDERQVTPSEMEKFDAMYRARMAALGAKGGKIGGKRRLTTLTDKRRREIALQAAKARWRR